MKILRAAIKSVFYDYPLQDLLGLIMKDKGRDKQFLDDISKIMSVREENMNQAVIKQTEALINGEWMKYETGNGSHGAFDRCFLLLKRWRIAETRSICALPHAAAMECVSMCGRCAG